MWRPIECMLIAATCVVCCCAGAQESRYARYMDERGLSDVYAEFLLDRLTGENGTARVDTATELAALYVRLLESPGGGGDRQLWAERAASLLRTVPEADSPSLRVSLARAAYLRAEAAAEKHMLMLSTPRESAEAERVFREITPALVQLAQRSHQHAQRLEIELGKQLSREDEDQVTSDLAEARRNRSISFYYAGWSNYYLSQLTGDPSLAEQALRQFGWILGAPDGAAASVDRLQPGLLRFEHVARAAVGSALACSATGRSLEARAWLDAVARATDAPADVRAQLPGRRIRVLAEADAWVDVDTVARRSLAAGEGAYDPLFARLVCILVLPEAEKTTSRNGQLLRRLADDAIASLVTEGEVAQVVDLVRQFGVELVGSDGFVALFVQGVLALERADELVEKHGSEDPRAVTALLEAAEALTNATAAEDSERFPADRVRAMLESGTALYTANRLQAAAEIFERCYAIAENEAQRQRAAWMTVVSLEEAVESGRADLAEDRDRAATLFLATFPASEQAALLALRPSTARLLSEPEAIRILLDIPPDAPSHASARRRAAGLLYKAYRGADSIGRGPAAERFMALAEELIVEDSIAMRASESDAAAALAPAIVTNARRLVDAALGSQPPQIERAMLAMDTIDRVVAFADLDLAQFEDEILFRRLQIASAQGDSEEAHRLLDRLNAFDGPYADAGLRVLYRDAVRAWIADGSDLVAAETVVELGVSVDEQLATSGAATAARVSVLETIAGAADALLRSGSEQKYVQISVDARRSLVELGSASRDTIRRLATGLAATGDRAGALEMWLTALQQAEQDSDAWFEARLESLRLLRETDPESARQAAQQFVALHPRLGPPAFRAAFREVVESLLGEVSGGGP